MFLYTPNPVTSVVPESLFPSSKFLLLLHFSFSSYHILFKSLMSYCNFPVPVFLLLQFPLTPTVLHSSPNSQLCVSYYPRLIAMNYFPFKIPMSLYPSTSPPLCLICDFDVSLCLHVSSEPLFFPI